MVGMRTAGWVYTGLVALVAIPTAVVSVLAHAGALDWRIDLVANARVQLWWLSGALLVLALLSRSSVAIVPAVVAVVANLAVIIPLYLPVSPPDIPADLRIVTFNLRSNNPNHAEVVAWLRQVDADVVFLQEGTPVWEEALAPLTRYDIVSGRTGDLIFGTIALVPPGSAVTNHGFELSATRAVETTVGGVAILSVHPLAPVTPWQAVTRDAQLAEYTDWAVSTPGPRVVTGDFNATPWTAPFRHMLAAGGLVNSQRGFGTAPTWSVDEWWRLPIDHLLHSEELAVVHREVGPDLGSDHRPVVIDLALTG